MIIKNGYILRDGIQKRDIRIEGNTITEIGKDLTGDAVDASGHLVMPGLVNTHTHLAMTLFRGYADDMPLQTWLEDYIWPKEMKLTPYDCYYGNLLGIIEMIRSGTTCFNDMYFFGEKTVESIRRSGIRAVLSLGVTDMGNEHMGKRILTQVLRAINMVKEPRIKTAFGPHSVYMCSSDFLYNVKEHAHNLKKLIHIHLHETKKEIKESEKTHGKPPIEMLDSLGFLGDNVCAAHLVHVSQKELAILKNRNVKVSHCPASNLKLGNGIAPVAEMVRQGICVSLGTDGAASNNTQDLVAEMRLMALLQKEKNAEAMRADTAVKIATEHGGTALGWNIGKIEKGFLADLIFIDLKKSCMVPSHNLVSNVVYSMNSAAVDTVMVDGSIIMEKGRILTLDEQDILNKAQQRAFDVVNR
jgi:5-methylthioadenosine/S-adenosylhomocysteine deaminase